MVMYIQMVIPAQAGMIPNLLEILMAEKSYPCTSGDDPMLETHELGKKELSLHKRG